MMNSIFKNFVKYRITIYTIIFIVVAVIFLIIYDLKDKPGYDEVINIFVASNEDTDDLNDELNKLYYLSSIKEVNIDVTNPEDSDFGIIFQTRGITNTDFIIIPLGLINEGSYNTYFEAIDGSYLDDLFEGENNLTYYKENEKILGIKLENYFEDDLYLFINKKSDKSSFVTKNGSDYSLIAFKYLIGASDEKEE